MATDKWVAYTDDGFVDNWDDDSCFFATKGDILKQLKEFYADEEVYTKIKRVKQGEYVYIVYNCDDNSVEETVYIEKVTYSVKEDQDGEQLSEKI